MATCTATSQVIPRPEGAKLLTPPGFEVKPFAEEGFNTPRWLALAPNGDVFVADSGANRIIIPR